jgi:hypothetical protein
MPCCFRAGFIWKFAISAAAAAGAAAVPERDKFGNLAFRAISYTPWPVPSDYEGERLRIDVGPIAARETRYSSFVICLAQQDIQLR